MACACLLLDEMISPSLANKLWNYDFDAVPVRNRGLLSAPDIKVWRSAQSEQRTVVTSNERDFRKLSLGPPHHGLVFIPNGGNRDEQFLYIHAAWSYVVQSNVFTPNFTNKITSVSCTCQVLVEDLSVSNGASHRKGRLH